jgi:hypothetical protein
MQRHGRGLQRHDAEARSSSWRAGGRKLPEEKKTPEGNPKRVAGTQGIDDLDTAPTLREGKEGGEGRGQTQGEGARGGHDTELCCMCMCMCSVNYLHPMLCPERKSTLPGNRACASCATAVCSSV